MEQSSDEEEEEDEDDDEEEEDEEDDESGSEEFADPDTADLERDHIDDDGEISSDDALCSSDNENLKDFVFRGSTQPKVPVPRIKKRPTAADFMSSDSEANNRPEEEGSDDEAEEDDLMGSEDEDEDEDEEDEEAFDGVLLEAEETDDDEGDDDEEEDDEDDEDEDESGEDEDEDEDDEDDEDEEADDGKDGKKTDLRKLLVEDQKLIVSTMSQAAKADAEKGIAVRSQRRSYDSILNLRIRLQKALVAANTFPVVENENPDAKKIKKPYQAAEEAAVKLWNTIDSVRHSFMPETYQAKVGDKRKREMIDLDTPSQEIWETMALVEKDALQYRRKVLEKWSARVRSSTVSTAKTRQLGGNNAASAQSHVSVLDEQLVNTERLVKKARTPRSCAPAQAAKKVEEDPEIYDDADFYQLLLKELVDQRSSDAAAPGESVATVRWAALKEAKTRKLVDRKASKGRKLRYTVHEKLQNFMAPEDRRSWEEHAIDRFFGTLFGQKMVLTETVEEEEEDTEMGGVSVEEEGLKLFRS